MTVIARRLRTACGLFLAGAFLLVPSREVLAQRARIPGPPTSDVTIGGGIASGVTVGEGDANLRANATTLRDYRLFSTETTLRPSPVVDFRIAQSVASRVAVEIQLRVAKPELRSSITNDVESAADVTVSERLTEVLFGGGVRVRFDSQTRPSRTIPHLSAGIGLLRRTFNDGASVEQSPAYYAGGGVRQVLTTRPGGFPRTGIRVDAQVLLVQGGLGLDDELTRQFSVTGGVFFSF